MNEVFCPASGVGEGIDRWTEHTRIRRWTALVYCSTRLFDRTLWKNVCFINRSFGQWWREDERELLFLSCLDQLKLDDQAQFNSKQVEK
jgi:hypothetical protein